MCIVCVMQCGGVIILYVLVLLCYCCLYGCYIYIYIYAMHCFAKRNAFHMSCSAGDYVYSACDIL